MGLDGVVGVPDPVDDAVAAFDHDQLSQRARAAVFGLQPRVVLQALEHDGLHFRFEAGKAPEPVEHALAPEEIVGVGGQFGAVRAELGRVRVGAVLGEIARDDAVLQHAAEQQRGAARRPGEPAGGGEIAADHHDGAERKRGDRAADAGERHAGAGDQGREQRRRRRAPSAPQASRCGSPPRMRRTAPSATRSKPRSCRRRRIRRCSASTASPAKMSVSRRLVSQGRVVMTDSRAMTASSVPGRRAEAVGAQRQRQRSRP